MNTLTKWEYKTVIIPLNADGKADPTPSMNEYGQLGWEVIQLTSEMSQIVIFLKRPMLPESSVPDVKSMPKSLELKRL